jgi:hypothetical protein
MLKTLTALLLLASVIPVAAQDLPAVARPSVVEPPRQPVVPEQFTIQVTPAQVDKIGEALAYLPKREADPLIAHLQKQVNDQVKAANPK